MGLIRTFTLLFALYLSLLSTSYSDAQENQPVFFVREFDSKTFESWCLQQALKKNVALPEGVVVDGEKLFKQPLNAELSGFYVAEHIFGAVYLSPNERSGWRGSFFVPTDVHKRFVTEMLPKPRPTE